MILHLQVSELAVSGGHTRPLHAVAERLSISFGNNNWVTFFDGYCSTVQGLLDWFEVDLGFI